MRKSILFIFISILTIIFLFGTAALIDRCSILSGPEVDKVDVKETEEDTIEKEMKPEEEATEEEKTQEETIKETNDDDTSDKTEEESDDKEEPEDEEPQPEAQAPTIDLLIYEGPTYSEDDDVCYFRIEAVVTGTPNPTVVFSKDDSGGAWGPLKTQINLNNPSDTYILNATATNLVDTATDSIELSWGCDPATKGGNRNPIINFINITGGTPLFWTDSKYDVDAVAEDPDGDSLSYTWSVSGGNFDDIYSNPTVWNTPNNGGTYTISIYVDDGNGGSASLTKSVDISETSFPISPVTTEFPIVISEGGMIEYDMTETHSNIIQQVLTYEIGDTEDNWVRDAFISFAISDLTEDILSAHLTFNLSGHSGDLTPFLPLKVVATYWGPTPLSKPGYVFGTICTANNSNFSADNGNLKTELLRAIENGQERFQVVVTTGGLPPCDNDSIADLWLYNVNDISLIVTYRP